MVDAHLSRLNMKTIVADTVEAKLEKLDISGSIGQVLEKKLVRLVDDSKDSAEKRSG